MTWEEVKKTILGAHRKVNWMNSKSKLSDFYFLSQAELPENHILHDGTYPYGPCSLYMGVASPAGAPEPAILLVIHSRQMKVPRTRWHILDTRLTLSIDVNSWRGAIFDATVKIRHVTICASWKFSLNFASSSFVIRVNFFHPCSFIVYYYLFGMVLS